jgi:hypothetical protein
MKTITEHRRYGLRTGGLVTLSGATLALVTLAANPAPAGHGGLQPGCGDGAVVTAGTGPVCVGEPGGTWTWQRSPDEEKRVIMGLYNRYCIRCHGVDGRGVWDMPGVPDFTNARWQTSRSDNQLVRIILEGRGAVMPPFRGTMTLEEGWGMARYLRTFVPGSETSRPDLGTTGREKTGGAEPAKDATKKK